MVRVEYNKKSAIPELAQPIKPLFKGISRMVLSTLLLSQPLHAAEMGAAAEREAKAQTPKMAVLSHRRPLLERTPGSRHLKIGGGSKAGDSPQERMDTLSIRSAFADHDEEFDRAIADAAGNPPILDLPARRFSFDIGPASSGAGGYATPDDVSSVSVEVHSPLVGSPLTSPVGVGFRPDSAPEHARRAQVPTASASSASVGHRRARRMSMSGMPATGNLKRSASATLREVEDDRARILSLDGGGYRGLLSAAIVWNMQAKFRVDLPASADLIAGASAGGLNALGYASGMKADEVVSFYREHGTDIFSASAWRSATSFSGMARAKYGRTSIDALLDKQFGELRLGDLGRKVLIPSVNILTGRPEIYTTREAIINPLRNFKVKNVAASTSAAPSFFGAASFEGPDGAQKYMADGGLFANNPIMAAISEVSSMGYDPRKAVAISIGTGEVSLARDGSSMTDAGALKWGPGSTIKLIMAVSQKFAHDAARGIFGENYARIQAELEEARASMDDTSKGQTDYLMDLAARMVDEREDRLERVVRVWEGEAAIDMEAMD